MTEQRYGRIVMTTSSAGLYGQAGLSAYAAAKGALIGLTRSLGLEGAELGIKVNAIAPLGHTRLNADLPDLERRALFERHFPPELVAPLVALLAHPDCPVNGQIFAAGGGRFTRAFIAEGAGYLDVEATTESVRDHLATVLSDGSPTVPVSASDTFARSVELIARA
jgi:NAD(P)-dependent dehydrogenase (short-subunit alcohol dehydrogenase family)